MSDYVSGIKSTAIKIIMNATNNHHQLLALAMGTVATVATVAAVINKKNNEKKKETFRCFSFVRKTSSSIQKSSRCSTIVRRSSLQSSMVSSCISAMASLIPKSDKETKRITVLDAIAHICAESNHNEQDDILRDIHKALEEGDNNLEAAILSGGNGSYSFIVFVENRPELCLYAELTFGDNMEQRAENEWANMRSHYSTPLGSWDVVEEDGSAMKLLVAEWSNKKTCRTEGRKH
jgi:hypothetical protein